MKHGQPPLASGVVTIKLGALRGRLHRWMKVAYLDKDESPTRSEIVRQWIDERLTEEVKKLPPAKRKLLEE